MFEFDQNLLERTVWRGTNQERKKSCFFLWNKCLASLVDSRHWLGRGYSNLDFIWKNRNPHTHTSDIWVLKLPTKMSQSTKLGESYFVDLLDPFTDRRMACQKLRKPGIQGTFCLILQICCPPPPTDLSSVNPEKFQIRKSRRAWCDCFWFRKFVTIESSQKFSRVS